MQKKRLVEVPGVLLYSQNDSYLSKNFTTANKSAKALLIIFKLH